MSLDFWRPTCADQTWMCGDAFMLLNSANFTSGELAEGLHRGTAPSCACLTPPHEKAFTPAPLALPFPRYDCDGNSMPLPGGRASKHQSARAARN